MVVSAWGIVVQLQTDAVKRIEKYEVSSLVSLAAQQTVCTSNLKMWLLNAVHTFVAVLSFVSSSTGAAIASFRVGAFPPVLARIPLALVHIFQNKIAGRYNGMEYDSLGCTMDHILIPITITIILIVEVIMVMTIMEIMLVLVMTVTATTMIIMTTNNEHCYDDDDDDDDEDDDMTIVMTAMITTMMTIIMMVIKSFIFCLWSKEPNAGSNTFLAVLALVSLRTSTSVASLGIGAFPAVLTWMLEAFVDVWQ